MVGLDFPDPADAPNVQLAQKDQDVLHPSYLLSEKYFNFTSYTLKYSIFSLFGGAAVITFFAESP